MLVAPGTVCYPDHCACLLQAGRRGNDLLLQVDQLNEFLDQLPEVPRDKVQGRGHSTIAFKPQIAQVCVDDSVGYQASVFSSLPPMNSF